MFQSKGTALVTGGASGIGKVIAQRLANDGFHVVIGDTQCDLGYTTAKECGFAFLEQDVCDEVRWRDVIDRIEGQYGGLSILVNNAGVLGPMDAVDPEHARLSDWKRVFAVNVEGVFLGCRTAIPAMRRVGGGGIINVASVAGIFATPYATAYGASKAAVRQLTKSVAQHCVQWNLNIRCNAVNPGNVLTNFWEKFAEETAAARKVSVEEILREGSNDVPMGDFTLPEDVAGAISFLASKDARHITGAELSVDGGLVHCDTYHLPSKKNALSGISDRSGAK